MGNVGAVDKAKAFELLKFEKRRGDESHLTQKRADDAIIDLLEDQHPHSVAEIASKVNLSAGQIQYVFQFLAKYSLITYDEERETAIIRDDFLALT